MANTHTTELITHYKRAILNHLGYASVYFMTNKPVTYNGGVVNHHVDTNRKNNLHAHFRVQTYSISQDGFRVYDIPKYYYVTSSIFEVKNILSLNLREDLILSWIESSKTGKHKAGQILLIDENKKELYDIPLEELISLYYKHLGVENLSVNFNHDKLIGFDLALLAKYKAAFDNESAPVEQYLDANWKPEYIGNTSYSQYRTNTYCTARVYDRNGKKIAFAPKAKSIKQLYDLLSGLCSAKSIGVSYKTFQRRAATSKPIILPSGTVIIVSKYLNYSFPEAYNEHIYNSEFFGEAVYTTEDLEVKEMTKENAVIAIGSVDGEIEVDDIENEKTPMEIESLIKNATEDNEQAIREALLLQFGFPSELACAS